MAILWGTGFMGNGKSYEIGTSLAEMAFMANGLIPGPLLSVPLLFAVFEAKVWYTQLV